jgi:hypothetical protein
VTTGGCGDRGRGGEGGLTRRGDEEQPTAFDQVNGVGLDVCPGGALAQGRGEPTYPEAMKVLEGLKAIEPGSAVPVTELGLPVTGRRGLLLVFWKST